MHNLDTVLSVQCSDIQILTVQTVTFLLLFNKLYRASVIILYYNQQMHNYFTNYHTATCFDTVVQLLVIQFTIKILCLTKYVRAKIS